MSPRSFSTHPRTTPPFMATHTTIHSALRRRWARTAKAARRARGSPRERYALYEQIACHLPAVLRGGPVQAALTRAVLGNGVEVSDDCMSVEHGGFRITAPRRFLQHFYCQPYEPLLVEWIRSTLRPGDIAVDVGAHVGYLTLCMARLVGRSGSVFSFEPAIENLEYLRGNLQANQVANVHVVGCALSEGSGLRGFNLNESSDSYSFYEHPNTATRERTIVPCCTLDQVHLAIAELFPDRSPTLLKVDAEGAELEILAGGQHMLSEVRPPRLAIEWNPKMLEARGLSREALPDALAQLGRPLVVLDDFRGRRTTVDECLSALEDPKLFRRWFSNIVVA